MHLPSPSLPPLPPPPPSRTLHLAQRALPILLFVLGGTLIVIIMLMRVAPPPLLLPPPPRSVSHFVKSVFVVRSFLWVLFLSNARNDSNCTSNTHGFQSPPPSFALCAAHFIARRCPPPPNVSAQLPSVLRARIDQHHAPLPPRPR
jgi:hypothetical protein